MSNHATNGAASQWLNTPEAASLLGISATTLRRMRNRIPCLEPGRHYKRVLTQKQLAVSHAALTAQMKLLQLN